MKEYGTDIDVRMMKRSRLNITIEFLLVTFLAFMSFAFGARSARTREVVIILAGMDMGISIVRIVFLGCLTAYFVTGTNSGYDFPEYTSF